MGIVKISDQMHENLRVASSALSRSINAQAEHWLRIGMLAELHPQLSHSDICQLLIRAEQEGGLDLARSQGQGGSGMKSLKLRSPAEVAKAREAGHLIAEVLAALQRIGRRPPPAVLVRPEDILEAVRASMLLGAVVPDLRQEIEVLGTDLAELVRLREGIARERK
eukprot:gene15469-18903_t